MTTEYEQREAERQQESLTEKQRVTALAYQLAIELGDGWAVTKYPGLAVPRNPGDTYSWAEVLRASDGARFNLHGSGWAGRGRIGVYGEFPHDERNNTYGPRYGTAEARAVHATVAAERCQGDTLEATARGVVRRVWPIYEKAYADALTAKARADAYQNSAETNARKMRIAFGSDEDANTYRRNPRDFYFNVAGTYASGSASDESVSFQHLSTTIAKALRIAAILAEKENDR